MNTHPPSDAIRSWRVLVVEDEPLVSLDLEFGLNDAGATVVGPAARCAAALDLIEAEPPLTAAVLDVNLGGETCEAVAQRLRQLGVPYILHTGEWQAEGELVDALDAPIVPKPASITTLVGALAELRPPEKVG